MGWLQEISMAELHAEICGLRDYITAAELGRSSHIPHLLIDYKKNVKLFIEEMMRRGG